MAEPRVEEWIAQLPVIMVPIARIRRFVGQARQTFDEQAMAELCANIGSNGLINPVLLEPDSEHRGDFRVVAGERRWRAFQRLEYPEIPAKVLPKGADVFLVGLVDNLGREDLNPIEEAQGYAFLMQDRQYSQTAVARYTGKESPHISARLALLKLPEELQAQVASGRLGIAHGLILVRRCKSQTEMRTAVAELAARMGGVGKISLAALGKHLTERERLQDLTERQIDPDFVLPREFAQNIGPAAARLLGLLSELVGEEGRPPIARADFLRLWISIPRVERTRFLALLRSITGRAQELMRLLREEGSQQTRRAG